MPFTSKRSAATPNSKIAVLAVSMIAILSSQPSIAASEDLIALHYDVSPDLDDLQAIAAGANLSEWFAVNPAVVIGTYGRVDHSSFGNLEFLYNVDTNTLGQGPNIGETRLQKAQAVANAAYGSENYLDTGSGWTQSVNAQAAIFWPVLQNGNTVSIADGGPMDFTADVLTRLQTHHGATNAQLKQVRVVQHSLGFNVQQTLPANLSRVSNLATYITIDNGNVGNNSTANLEDSNSNTTSSAFALWARNANSHASAWNNALDRFTAKIDFSDTVEYLHILNVPLSEVSDISTFSTYCERNNCLEASEPATQTTCNGHQITIDLSIGQLPTSGDDIIAGSSGDDIIDGLSGNDTICGFGGNDIINAGEGDDWVDGGEGSDDIQGSVGNDELFGGVGDDVIRGGSGDDDISGEEGDDSLMGQPGNDIIDGGDGVDEINGGGGNDTIYTGYGATVGSGVFVTGSVGNDTIFGGPDADDIKGSNGADTIYGDGGNDIITGGNGRDIINGGEGNDNIKGQESRDTINGDAGDDIINGGAENDTINGGTGDDSIHGGPGDDILRGDSGADSISGGNGDDTLVGGASLGDVCNGQTGTDSGHVSCESLISVP